MKELNTLKLTLAMLVFGTVGIFVRYIPLPSGFIAMSRGFIGVLFLLLFFVISRKRIDFSAIRENLVKLLFSGAFIGVNWILLFESYNHTTVATATLCYYMAPVFVLLASAVLFKESISIKKWICIVCAVGGMVLVSGVAENGIPDISEASGILLGLGAAVFYASVIMFNRRMKNISSYDMTAVQLFVAAVVVMPYSLIAEDISFNGTPWYSFLLLALVGILHTGIAYVAYFGSVNALPAEKVAIFAYIDPIVAILLSFLLLKEDMSLIAGLGAVLILASTLISEVEFSRLFVKTDKTNKTDKN